MRNKHMLHEAQMHAECLNESWCELLGLIGDISKERTQEIHAEISVRVWAVIYLIQAATFGKPLSDDAKEVIREANAFNGDVLSETVDLQGLH